MIKTALMLGVALKLSKTPIEWVFVELLINNGFCGAFNGDLAVARVFMSSIVTEPGAIGYKSSQVLDLLVHLIDQ